MFANTLIKNWWRNLYLISLMGIVFMWINAFEVGSTLRSEVWKEQLILPFYFTYISNFLALILGFTKGFTSLGNNRNTKRLEALTSVNLSVTFLVYWVLLFPAHHPESPFVWLTNMIVHLVVPLFTVLLFFLQNTKDNDDYKFNIYKNSGWHMTFVFGYFAMALIIYFSLGGTKDDAIYGFINVKGNAWYMTVVYIVGIGGLYFGLTLLAYWLVNEKKHKSKKTNKK